MVTDAVWACPCMTHTCDCGPLRRWSWTPWILVIYLIILKSISNIIISKIQKHIELRTKRIFVCPYYAITDFIAFTALRGNAYYQFAGLHLIYIL